MEKWHGGWCQTGSISENADLLRAFIHFTRYGVKKTTIITTPTKFSGQKFCDQKHLVVEKSPEKCKSGFELE